MFAYIFQNRGERADPYGIVIWNGDVMNAVFRGCQPYVASGLGSLHNPKADGLLPNRRLRRLWVISCSNDFFANKMEANHFWLFFGFKVTIDSITNIHTQIIKIITLGKNRFTKRPRRIAALNRIFDKKDYLVHTP